MEVEINGSEVRIDIVHRHKRGNTFEAWIDIFAGEVQLAGNYIISSSVLLTDEEVFDKAQSVYVDIISQPDAEGEIDGE